MMSPCYYLYGLTDRPDDALVVPTGLEERLPLSISVGECVAIVSPLTNPAVAPTEVNLWRHEALVEALMRDRTVLPVRFGTVLCNMDYILTMLERHEAWFLSAMDRVRGCVELSIRVLWDEQALPIGEPIAPPQPSGRAGHVYLLTRLAEQQQTMQLKQQAEQVATLLDHALAPFIIEGTHRFLVTPRMPVTAAYLVPREYIDSVRDAIAQLHRQHPYLRFLCTGPWPPYSFVEPLQTHTSVAHAS